MEVKQGAVSPCSEAAHSVHAGQTLPFGQHLPVTYLVIKGGGLFEIQTPPARSSRPPKVFETVFLQFQILGESAGAKGAENFILTS